MCHLKRNSVGTQVLLRNLSSNRRSHLHSFYPPSSTLLVLISRLAPPNLLLFAPRTAAPDVLIHVQLLFGNHQQQVEKARKFTPHTAASPPPPPPTGRQQRRQRRINQGLGAPAIPWRTFRLSTSSIYVGINRSKRQRLMVRWEVLLLILLLRFLLLLLLLAQSVWCLPL